MKDDKLFTHQTRREFLKSISFAGSAVFLGFGGIFTLAKPVKAKSLLPEEFEYKFRTISVDHVKEVGEWINKLRAEGRVGKNEVFRGYLDGFVFNSSEIAPDAKSIILVTVPDNPAKVIFNYQGKKIEIVIPSGYTDNGLTFDIVKDRLRKDFNISKDDKLEWSRLPLKTLAVRSGLAEYGKNNISFVDGYGSFHALLGFYTNTELPDNWRPLKMMRLCKGCKICIEQCPMSCIREEDFVVKIDDCVTLYNEREEPIANHIRTEAHNALVGCVKCQFPCPANVDVMKNIEVLAEVSEKETEFLLSDKTDEKIHELLKTKLKFFPYITKLDYFRRNFKLVFNNVIKSV